MCGREGKRIFCAKYLQLRLQPIRIIDISDISVSHLCIGPNIRYTIRSSCSKHESLCTGNKLFHDANCPKHSSLNFLTIICLVFFVCVERKWFFGYQRRYISYPCPFHRTDTFLVPRILKTRVSSLYCFLTQQFLYNIRKFQPKPFRRDRRWEFIWSRILRKKEIIKKEKKKIYIQ